MENTPHIQEIEQEAKLGIFQIGSIVALKSHPYINTVDDGDEVNKKIIFSGETQLISPLMVVIETLIENKQIFDEHSGIQIAGYDENQKIFAFQCKCLWYSSKSNQYEESWFSSKLLKLLVANEKSKSSFEYEKMIKSFGAFVTLKTIQLESVKKRSFLNQKGNSNDENSKTINALLTFVPPLMQVIGTAKSESKEPIFDPKTNLRKRFISRY